MKIGCSCVDINCNFKYIQYSSFYIIDYNPRDHSSDSTFDLNPNLSLSNSFKY